MEYQEILCVLVAAAAAVVLTSVQIFPARSSAKSIDVSSHSSRRRRKASDTTSDSARRYSRKLSRSSSNLSSRSPSAERSPSSSTRSRKISNSCRFSPYGGGGGGGGSIGTNHFNPAISVADEPQNRSLTHRKRLQIATEILTSEQSYVQSLDLVHEKIYIPLQQVATRNPRSSESWITRRTFNSIFSNFQDILSVNRELLRQLEERLIGSSAQSRRDSLSRILPRPVSAVSVISENSFSSEDERKTLILNLSPTSPISTSSIPVQISSEPPPFLHISLKHWNPCTSSIGDIFLNLYPFFKMYAVYVRNFSLALETLNQQSLWNEKLKKFIGVTTADARFKNLGLPAYLIMPIQRIPRYILLLQSLLNNTPVDHSDYQNIRQALDKIESVADFVNDQIRVHENSLKLYEIQQRMTGYLDQDGMESSIMQPGRTLLKEGRLMKITKKDFQPRVVFLMNDILVYVIAKRSFQLFSGQLAKEDSFMYGNEFICRHTFSLGDVKLVNLPEKEEKGYWTAEKLLELSQIQYKSIQLFCQSFEEKMDWLRTIQTAANDYLQSRETRSRNVSLASIRQRGDTRESIYDVPSIVPEDENDIVPPIWLPDGVASNCMICSAPFTIFRRKHHCRLCGCVICNNCSTKSLQLPFKGQVGPARVCDSCFSDRLEREKKKEIKNQRIAILQAQDEQLTSIPNGRQRSISARSTASLYLDYNTSVFKDGKKEAFEWKTIELLNQILERERRNTVANEVPADSHRLVSTV